MTVVWSNRALRSLTDIHHHISTDSKEAANRTTIEYLNVAISWRRFHIRDVWWPGIIDQAFEN